MTDYIKREDAIKAMARGMGIPYTDFIEVAERCMDDIPTADVVEVVRCKDCIYRFGSSCKWREDETPDPDDYCSIGENL